MPKQKEIFNKCNTDELITKRFNITSKFIIISFFILVVGLMILQVGNQSVYQTKLEQATQKIVLSKSVPRGRIYDCHY
ncbi:MAG: hypothetical protein WC343_08465, partial [Bacilli bacterium]